MEEHRFRGTSASSTAHRGLRLAATAALAALLPLSPLVGPLAAQEKGEPITIGTAVTIDSEVLGEERRVLVHLPDGYETAPSARYPVLYLLDGGAQFHHVTGIVDFLAGIYWIPPMIVVGVTNTDRSRDLTPPADNTTNTIVMPSGDSISVSHPTAGGADAFLRFLTEELAAWVESEYRTAPFRLLVGHSLGGLFALHALTTRPESFQAYIAISPTLIWDDRALLNAARTGLRRIPLDGRFLYLTVGDREGGPMLGGLREFAATLEYHDPEGLRWWYRVMPDESHPSVVHRTVYDGLEAIFEPYRVPVALLEAGDVAAVETHFAERPDIYGYEIAVPEKVVNAMGYMQLFIRRAENAVEIFRRGVELYPRSANAYDSLGDGLEAAGRLEEALESRELAVRHAEEDGDPRLEQFREKRDVLQDRLAGEIGGESG